MVDLYRVYLIHGEEDKQVILRSVIENALGKRQILLSLRK